MLPNFNTKIRLTPFKSSTRYPPEKIDTGEIASHKNAFYMCKISEQKPAVNVHGNLYVAGQAWNFFIEHVKRKGTDA